MTRRDRLRELLDAVLDEGNRTLDQMAGDAFASPYHFSRVLSRTAGEAPVAMRRRVMLERAAWELEHGSSVTDAAWAAGYESVEGFSRAFTRAFGHPPSTPASSHWLPAPNGIHFHPPTSLWVHTTEHAMNPLTEQLVEHDLDDTRHLIEVAKGLGDEDYRAPRLDGLSVTSWDGPEESIAKVLEHQVFTKEVWLAAIEGTDFPQHAPDPDAATLLERQDAVAPRWLATVRELDRRGAWDDRLIDALCDPPESFQMGSVVAHVLTYAAHRRQLARLMLIQAGAGVDHGEGDPINWLRAKRGETTGSTETTPTGQTSPTPPTTEEPQ
ncbi:MAG TPA: helix-turn-helix domain-containing protein [Nocardioides sp.]|nr:helix-turn-helix domain-containing protein [Nocardioides sp.]